MTDKPFDPRIREFDVHIKVDHDGKVYQEERKILAIDIHDAVDKLEQALQLEGFKCFLVSCVN